MNRPRRSSIGIVMSTALLLSSTAAAQDAAREEREAEHRAECVNNLKYIGLALSNYEFANGHFPGNIADGDGKPLLSWRVAILPQLGEEGLYKQFKLDEPWDSPHNKPLLDKLPDVFRCPSLTGDDPTLTHYQGFEGPRGLFEKGVKVRIQDVPDGTAFTIAVVEAKEGTPWTKPSDLPFEHDPNASSLFGAGSAHPEGFNVLFADGSARFVKATVNPTVLQALITRNGGEVVRRDAF